MVSTEIIKNWGGGGNGEAENNFGGHFPLLAPPPPGAATDYKVASSVGLPTYQVIDKDEVCSSGKNYSLSGKTKDKKKSKKSSTETQTKSVSPFVLYQGSYIRKSTALYLLQKICQVSSDGLMRVRSGTAKPYICRHRK